VREGKGYVLDGTFDFGVIFVKEDPSSRRKRFRDRISSVAEGPADKSAIVANIFGIQHYEEMALF
jgi:hypothetical protein